LSRVYDETEKRFRVISMADNVSILTAFGNDLSYDDVFSQQLQNLVNKGDVVIALTGSGNSKNIVKGVETAKKAGAITIGFLGFQGGMLKDMVDHYILTPTDHYGRIEDVHLILSHVIAANLAEMKKKEKVQKRVDEYEKFWKKGSNQKKAKKK
jgi:D-sedoheptulose 7-phosphate isomerase